MEERIWAKKSLGQHFLNSPHVLEQIISAAHIQKGETVLEIGPGTGILTKALLQTGANVIAVEKDDRAYKLLQEIFSGEIVDGRLQLISGDVLDEKSFDLRHLPAYALVANIPYYITGAILEKFLEYEPRPSRMVLLVQKEVAERIIARPPDKKDHGKESVLSISVKAFGKPKIIATVPRGAFTPAPNVDSAILAIGDISDELFGTKGNNTDDIRIFFEIIHAGFAHKRKFLKRNLEYVIPAEKLAIIWQKADFNEKVRAEDLAPADWFTIHRMYRM
jgi:16S rRNA (adenine1518-N6/adenine1519-N6)-dimethyltransferase